MKKYLYSLSLFFILKVNIIASSSIGNNYTTTHISGDSVWSVAMPSPAKSVIYKNYRSAVEVDNIKVDGVTLKPLRSKTSHLPDSSVIELSSNVANIYNVRFFEFYFYRKITRLSSRVDFEVDFYDIPVNAKRVEVEYRIRFPDGTISDLIKIYSADRGSEPHEPTKAR